MKKKKADEVNDKSIGVDPINYSNGIAALILRRRMQILVHSYIYYLKGDNILTDWQWGEWGRELVQLQTQNQEIASQLPYAKAFSNFDASTGFNLPIDDPKIVSIGEHLLKLRDRGWEY